jgi:mannose-6-phosphate isomerase-like protein (cupin superfamily)
VSVTQGYVIHTDPKFGGLELIDVPKFRSEITDKWFNQTLCRVNDSVVRLGVVQGEFHWHKHDAEDEFFFVLEGRLLIDVEGQPTVALAPNQGYIVPRGVLHRTRAPERTAMLMMATAGVKPTGD